MSHYNVGVILSKENVDKLGLEDALELAMEPFDESKQVPAYPTNTIEELYAKLEKFRALSKKDKDDYYNLDYIKEKAKEGHFDSIESFIKFEYGQLEEDERKTPEGIPYTTYNPDSKWDWYVIGGRWDAYYLDNNYCLVKEVPVFNNRVNTPVQEMKEYYEAITTDADDRTSYQKQLLEQDFLLYKPEYYKAAYPTFDDYMKSKTSFSTYALLTADGEWLEPGRMGMFGMSQATPYDEAHFYEKFRDAIYDADPDDTFVVVDCHI